MDTIEALHEIRLRLTCVALERERAVEQALRAGKPQHEIAVAAGMGVRTVGEIARLRGIGRPRGRPEKPRRPAQP